MGKKLDAAKQRINDLLKGGSVVPTDPYDRGFTAGRRKGLEQALDCLDPDTAQEVTPRPFHNAQEVTLRPFLSATQCITPWETGRNITAQKTLLKVEVT